MSEHEPQPARAETLDGILATDAREVLADPGSAEWVRDAAREDLDAIAIRAAQAQARKDGKR